MEETYLAALRDEIARHVWDWKPETLYVGGGTPSTLDPETLAGVLTLIPGAPWIEATLEAAPGSLTLEKISAWRKFGFNRISMGVQSFVQREIARTGRKHNALIVAREIELLREAGISNINIDLIAGLAGQTESSWRESLDWIERLAPPHVSIYMLEVDQDSRLGAEILAGGARYGASEIPSDDLTADLYELAFERLHAMGLGRYEISNFSRPGFESRHNLTYWLLDPYAGFGADAHSFDGQSRWRNAESLTEYLNRVAPVREPAHLEEEKFYVGLRLDKGVRLDPADWRRFEEPIRRFLKDGLLETDGQILRLSGRGVLLSNEIFQEFVHI